MRRTFLPGAAAALLVAAVVLALPAGAGAPAPASAAGPAAMDHTHHAHAPRATVDAQVQAQVLTWTANNSFTAYASTPSSATAGPTTIVFENSAATGNTTGMQHTLTFDTTTPGFNHDVNVNILADPFDGQGGRHQVDVVLTPGKYRYGCAIPGHGAMVGTLVVTDGGGDTTAPAVTAAVSGDRDPEGRYVGSATVTLTATDSGSGVARVEYSLDGGTFGTYSAPVTVTAPGAHTVTYRATDNAGNTSVPQSVSFTVVLPPVPDTTPPVAAAQVTGERNADGAYVGTATVTVTATDTGSGVKSVEYAVDGGAFGAYTAPVTVTAPGAHTVRYRATDNAGNVSPVGSVSFTVVQRPAPDTTPPAVTASVTGERNATGDYVGSATVTLTATDSGSGVARIEYSLDGGPYAQYAAPVTVNQPGRHTVTHRATDNAGNTSSAGSVTFSVVPGGPGARCPVPDTRPTVWMGTFDSGVRNRVVRGGCTINNLIEDERTWATHGAFVRHVRTVADRLRCEGRITARERSRLIMAAARSGVGRPDPQGGYRSIFDGSAHSLHRWEHAGAGGFTLTRGGVLTSAGGPGLLWYPERAYQNFSLKLQWRDDAPGAGRADSGVSVRLGRAGDGVEVQLLDRAGGDPDKTGSIRGVDPVDLAGAHATPKGTWNDLEIRVSGRHYSVFRNGVLINEYVAPPGRYRLSGFIGLENHGPQDTVSFRNIRIAALAPTPDRGDNHG